MKHEPKGKKDSHACMWAIHACGDKLLFYLFECERILFTHSCSRGGCVCVLKLKTSIWKLNPNSDSEGFEKCERVRKLLLLLLSLCHPHLHANEKFQRQSIVCVCVCGLEWCGVECLETKSQWFTIGHWSDKFDTKCEYLIATNVCMLLDEWQSVCGRKRLGERERKSLKSGQRACACISFRFVVVSSPIHKLQYLSGKCLSDFLQFI